MVLMEDKRGENRGPMLTVRPGAAPGTLPTSTFFLGDTSLWWEA